jgi:hypothetical protein
MEYLVAEPVIAPSAQARADFRDLREFAVILRDAFTGP